MYIHKPYPDISGIYSVPLNLGSMASLRPSPTILKAKTTATIVTGSKRKDRIGNKIRITIVNHAAPGSGRRSHADTEKAQPASARMVIPIIIVISTIITGKQLGMTWLTIMCNLLPPTERAAKT